MPQIARRVVVLDDRDLPVLDLHVDAVQHLHRAVAAGDPLHLQQAHAGVPR
jgi:hypothetical protein